jgi:hypothetical protein
MPFVRGRVRVRTQDKSHERSARLLLWVAHRRIIEGAGCNAMNKKLQGKGAAHKMIRHEASAIGCEGYIMIGHAEAPAALAWLGPDPDVQHMERTCQAQTDRRGDERGGSPRHVPAAEDSSYS